MNRDSLPSTLLILMGVTLLLVAAGLMVTGCAGLDTQQQRMVSGAAMGGALAGPVGAAIGALGGWVVDATNRPPDVAQPVNLWD